jgi:hypothetical protein
MHAFSQNSLNWLAMKFDPKSVMMVFGKSKRCKISEIKSKIRSIWCELGYWLVLNPLGKPVDSHQYMGETTWRRCEGPNQIKAPASERPGWRYGDETVSWDVGLLDKELAVLASSNKILSIRYCDGPPETSFVCFPHQRS